MQRVLKYHIILARALIFALSFILKKTDVLLRNTEDFHLSITDYSFTHTELNNITE